MQRNRVFFSSFLVVPHQQPSISAQPWLFSLFHPWITSAQLPSLPFSCSTGSSFKGLMLLYSQAWSYTLLPPLVLYIELQTVTGKKVRKLCRRDPIQEPLTFLNLVGEKVKKATVAQRWKAESCLRGTARNELLMAYWER